MSGDAILTRGDYWGDSFTIFIAVLLLQYYCDSFGECAALINEWL